MNISTPLNYAPGGGEIGPQGGVKKISRASRAFLSYFHNIWEINPPLENFLDPPLHMDFLEIRILYGILAIFDQNQDYFNLLKHVLR